MSYHFLNLNFWYLAARKSVLAEDGCADSGDPQMVEKNMNVKDPPMLERIQYNEVLSLTCWVSNGLLVIKYWHSTIVRTEVWMSFVSLYPP